MKQRSAAGRKRGRESGNFVRLRNKVRSSKLVRECQGKDRSSKSNKSADVPFIQALQANIFFKVALGEDCEK